MQKRVVGRIMKSKIILVIGLLVLSSVVQARIPAKSGGGSGSSAVGAPAHGVAAHRIGRLVLAVNNNGTFGTGYSMGATQDYFTGLPVPSCEFPKNSSVQYMWAASFWIGAIVGRDTLVSTGAEAWSFIREMYPDEAPFGEMVHRSIIDPTQDEYEGAISEDDIISVYTDTYTAGIPADVISQRPHRPLNIEIHEASYAWSYSYAQDIVLFDYKIRNIGNRRLKSVYMGIYVDADVCWDCSNTNGFMDDICGFVHTVPAYCADCEYLDSVNVAWIADNDGDFGKAVRAPSVTATRIVRTPAEELDVSFNWWISNVDPGRDFGPREQSGKGRWPEEFRDYGTGGLGTPMGDENKYYIMRNKEFDYDQARTASITANDTLWLDPGDQASDFADGFDTRYLLSFGPFDISPGEILPVSFAYVAGINFHQDVMNRNNLPDRPDIFYNNLNFDSLGSSSRWASWIYDNPGVDTDSDGYPGEMYVCVAESMLVDSYAIPDTDPVQWEYHYDPSIADTCWITGDGVPDFRGASPPPAPQKWVNPRKGALKVRFNGFRSETTRDVFSGDLDFEGYRVYIARDSRASSYSLIASYDLEDFNKWVWDESRPGGAGYTLTETPFTRDSLQCLYGSSCDTNDFDPLMYSRNSPFVMPLYSDSIFYFEAQDFNVSSMTGTTAIRKPPEYADQPYPTSFIPEDADPDELTEDGYFKYFEYEITIDGLLPTVPYYVNVTAFDYGSPLSGLPSLETSVTLGSINAYPTAGIEEVADLTLKAYVFPNPYRIDAEYSQFGFEDLPDSDHSKNRLRLVHFANLPAKCTIRIFSIDGDLVREIEHDVPVTDPKASHETWDLITRNTQSVVSGLYYWTVETEEGDVQIGKLAIIM